MPYPPAHRGDGEVPTWQVVLMLVDLLGILAVIALFFVMGVVI